MSASKSTLFNLRLSPDYRLRLRAIAAHKGLDTEAACVRWLIAEKWDALKGDIGQPPAPADQQPKIMVGSSTTRILHGKRFIEELTALVDRADSEADQAPAASREPGGLVYESDDFGPG